MAAGTRFTTEQIKEAAALYYQYRSYAETARQCAVRWDHDKVSRAQIKHWDDNNDVFREGLKQEATRTDKRLSAKMLDLEEKALKFCIEKFEDPEGLKFKEVAWTAAVMHDKRQVLEGKATSISGPSKSFLDRLTEIENELANKSAERQASGTFGDVVRFPGKE